MKPFAKELNSVFSVLNSLTGTEVVEASTIEMDGKDLLHINICGRDSVWNETLHCVDMGMWVGNPFVGAMKGLSSNPNEPHPAYGVGLQKPVLELDNMLEIRAKEELKALEEELKYK